MKRILLFLLLAAPLCTFCKKPVETEPFPERYMLVDATKLDFSRFASNRTFGVDTNIEDKDISCKASATTWCEALYANGVVTVTVTTNEGVNSRSTVILLEGKGVRRSVAVNQPGRGTSIAEIKSDIKIPVVSATVDPAAQSGEGIEKSHDGLLSTIYHSRWSASVTPSAPVTLTYNFAASAGRMDYLVYNPRADGGTNGNFKEFDLYVATAAQPAPTLYGSYDFEGSAAGSVIAFSPALQNPTLIRFVVKSGMSDTAGIAGFASCAEMQFFRKNTTDFDYSTIFTDMTCSELKPGIGRTEIEQIEMEFFRDMAMEMLEGTYDTEFRVQEYGAWEHPDVMSAKNKSGKYSLRDNPTGIYVRRNEDLVVMAGDLHGKSVGLFVQDPAAPGNRPLSGTSYTLTPGLNKFKVSNDGLIYVMYHTRNWTGDEPEIKINIATGYVNGYFDSSKHTAEEWTERLSKATFAHFDLIGKYAHLTFQTDAFRQYTPDGMALIKKYDDLVWKEMDFLGAFKYDCAYNNRMYFVVMPSSWMVAGSYYTGYVTSSQSTVLNIPALSEDCWGPAHEVGHINQLRPGFNWTGMGEVSNNVHSLYIQTEWGKPSRLLDAAGSYPDRYAWAFTEILDRGACYIAHSDPFCKLVPFWQLKLYMHDVLGNTDFYKDVYQLLRERDAPSTAGQQQIAFVKTVCDAAELDLTDFFEAWGFLKTINVEIEDYASSRFTVTQAMIDDAKTYISKYPEPVHRFERIRDDNLADFR